MSSSSAPRLIRPSAPAETVQPKLAKYRSLHDVQFTAASEKGDAELFPGVPFGFRRRCGVSAETVSSS